MKAPRFLTGFLLGLLLGGGAVLLLERIHATLPSRDLLQARSHDDPFEIGIDTTGSPAERDESQETVEAARNQEAGSGHSRGPETEPVQVIQVIDGDTFEVKGDERVRILGIDTPERYKPYYREAREFLKDTILGKEIRLNPCESTPRDRYARNLAFVEIGGKDVGTELLRRGLARTLFIGSCSRKKSSLYLVLERSAFRQARGIWSIQQPRRVDHDQAGSYIGWMMNVTGQVRRVHIGPKAIHLNFGKDYRKDFTAVIFRSDLSSLSKQGLLMPVTDYKGKHVQVTGYLRSYQGPEILIDSADQIKVLR